MLVSDILVGGNQEVIALVFRGLEQIPVIEVGPTPFSGGVHRVFGQIVAEGPRSALI